MHLEDLTPAHVRRAVALYLEIAWPGSEFPRPRITGRDLEGAHTLEELFARFERVRLEEGPLSPRYTLRLGNKRYPFMKFVVQEYLVDKEYFFSVDTHDDLDVRPDNPDYSAWQELRAHNRALKQEIEAAWHAASLPTHRDLRRPRSSASRRSATACCWSTTRPTSAADWARCSRRAATTSSSPTTGAPCSSGWSATRCRT